MGSAQLLKTFSDLGFYDAPAIRLESNPQPAPATIATPGAAAAGQGNLRISPLQLAVAASTISNNGVMPAPTLLLQVEDPQGGWNDYPPLGEEHLVFTSSISVKAAKAMAHSYLPIWEISSLAFNTDNQPLTWFVGGTQPGAEHPLTIVVLLESKNLTMARSIGRNLLFHE
jgi:membrane peptidoglycan carboxypeptidase